jgi:hypothetical protein
MDKDFRHVKADTTRADDSDTRTNLRATKDIRIA